uniref:Uncharacterized protein n=1 Tax=Populus trichocarpa TaxID=3694 RepID=A9PGT8_POPTR|nr:unknown [Populus trichocarpa]
MHQFSQAVPKEISTIEVNNHVCQFGCASFLRVLWWCQSCSC